MPIEATPITWEQEDTVEYELLDAAGNPAKIDGAIAWSADPPDVCLFVPALNDDGTPDPNPLRTGVWMKDEAQAFVGELTIKGTADADLGAGVRPVPAMKVYSVVQPEGQSADLESVSQPRVKRALTPDQQAAAAQAGTQTNS